MTLLTSFNTGPTHKQQQGVVFIVVLVVVLLLAIAAAIMVRSSNTSLGLTTTAQVNQLLFQSSDVPLKALERESKDKDEMARLTSEDGPIGYLRVRGDDFDGAEYVLCYQPMLRSTLYAGESEHRVIVKDQDGNGGLGYKKDTSAYCQVSNANDFTSARQVVISQLSMTRPTLNDTLIDDIDVKTNETQSGNSTTKTLVKTHTTQPFLGGTGSDMTSVNSTEDMAVRVYVTSIVPGLSRSFSDVGECLEKPIGGLIASNSDNTPSQMQCINDTGTPYNIQVQDYMFINQAKAKAP